MYGIGASTEEAQQRVAEEIAQQFLVLASRSTEYVITGIVNAPMLSAAISDENASWIELSKKLGNLISRILKGKLNITVHNQIIGNKEMEKKTFIHTAVLVGILSGQTKNGLNLINAPTLAQEIGIDIKRSYEESTNIEAIVIQAEGHWIKGKNEIKIIALLIYFSFLCRNRS